MSLAEHEGVRRRQPAKYRSEIVDDCEALRMQRDRYSSARLLLRLREHHDFRIAQPVSWTPAPKPIPIPPKPQRIWFEMVDDERIVPPKVAEVKQAVVKYFKIDAADLDAETRLSRIVYPRQIGYYLARKLTARSLPEIGRHFGGRDHTTVLYGVRKIAKQVLTDWKIAYDVAHVEALI
jgi:hypothetical protein